MLTERGVPVDHTTVYRWVQRYGPQLDKRTRCYPADLVGRLVAGR